MSDVTVILSQIEAGDPSAADQLLPLVYEELRRLAAVRLASEKPGQTLQATAGVKPPLLFTSDLDALGLGRRPQASPMAHDQLVYQQPKCFTCNFRSQFQRTRKKLFPLLSRIQNIGYELGENSRTAEWYRENHRTPWVATQNDVKPNWRPLQI